MTRTLLVSIGIVTALASSNAYAWGPAGHRVVAGVAEKNLKAATKKRVKALLGEDVSLADVSNWADGYRLSHDETYNWHFVDVPLKENDYKPTRDCAETPRGDCVINALTREVAILKDKKAAEDDRIKALKFVVHFMGDVHQPLHCADNHDKGGNDVKVKWFNHANNLHKVWDSGIISEEQMEEAALVGNLNGSMTKKEKTATQAGTFEDWALESHKIAQNTCYAEVPKTPANSVPELDDQYYDATVTQTNIQLARAGVRLAKVLNDALGPKPPHH